MNDQIVLDSIHSDKDADGFHPLNVGKLSIASNNVENLLYDYTYSSSSFIQRKNDQKLFKKVS